MKKAVLMAFCIIALFSLLAMNTGTVEAPPKAGYQADDHTAVTTPTIDGKLTTPTEWDDAWQAPLSGGLNAVFRLKYTMAADFSWINQYYLIEFFDDNTNDAGDYYQICYAAATTFFGTPTGGTTPQTDCWRFDYTGHSKTASLTVYKGTGTGWATYTSWSSPTDFDVADSISASPWNSTPHWIVEIKVEHMHFTIYTEMWIRVAAYDASHASAGVQSWPPGSRDVPNDWGLLNALQSAFPETLSFGVMVLLSSVAVVVGSRYFRKRSRIESRS